MTTSPNFPGNAWVLEATIRTTPAADAQWQKQLDKLREIAVYEPETQTWHARLGVLDLAGVQIFDAAPVHGTEVDLAPVAVPAHWNAPVCTRTPDVAALLEAQTERGRPLGQLPLE